MIKMLFLPPLGIKKSLSKYFENCPAMQENIKAGNIIQVTIATIYKFTKTIFQNVNNTQMYQSQKSPLFLFEWGFSFNAPNLSQSLLKKLRMSAQKLKKWQKKNDLWLLA